MIPSAATKSSFVTSAVDLTTGCTPSTSATPLAISSASFFVFPVREK